MLTEYWKEEYAPRFSKLSETRAEEDMVKALSYIETIENVWENIIQKYINTKNRRPMKKEEAQSALKSIKEEIKKRKEQINWLQVQFWQPVHSVLTIIKNLISYYEEPCTEEEMYVEDLYRKDQHTPIYLDQLDQIKERARNNVFLTNHITGMTHLLTNEAAHGGV